MELNIGRPDVLFSDLNLVEHLQKIKRFPTLILYLFGLEVYFWGCRFLFCYVLRHAISKQLLDYLLTPLTVLFALV